jgi:hypothetical protein
MTWENPDNLIAGEELLQSESEGATEESGPEWAWTAEDKADPSAHAVAEDLDLTPGVEAGGGDLMKVYLRELARFPRLTAKANSTLPAASIRARRGSGERSRAARLSFRKFWSSRPKCKPAQLPRAKC